MVELGMVAAEQQKAGVREIKTHTRTRTHTGAASEAALRVHAPVRFLEAWEWVWVWVYQASPGRRRAPESSRAPARSIVTRRAPAAHTAGPSPATKKTHSSVESRAETARLKTWPPPVLSTPEQPPHQKNKGFVFRWHIFTSVREVSLVKTGWTVVWLSVISPGRLQQSGLNLFMICGRCHVFLSEEMSSATLTSIFKNLRTINFYI